MSSSVRIEVDSELLTTVANGYWAGFQRKCIAWADRLNESTGGGISIKFVLGPRSLVHISASFWWCGKEIATIVFHLHTGSICADARAGTDTRRLNPKIGASDAKFLHEKILEKNAQDILERSLHSLVSRDIKRLSAIESKLGNVSWESLLSREN